MMATVSPPAHLLHLSEQEILAQSGKQNFERGQQYIERVSDLSKDGDTVRATVFGTADYRVAVWHYQDGSLASWCSCPIGASFSMGGLFCKHSVAVSLSLAAGRTLDSDIEDVRQALLSKDKAALIEIILDEAERNEGMRNRLALLPGKVLVTTSGSTPATGLDPNDLIKTALNALRDDDEDNYYNGCESLSEALKLLNASITPANAEQTVAACEELLQTLVEYGSSWRIDQVEEEPLRDAAGDAWEAHYAACLAQASSLDKERLYSWLEGNKDQWLLRLHPVQKREYQRLLGGPGARQRRLS